jgi:glycosyltransferase involved in cell wall biosynthesis
MKTLILVPHLFKQGGVASFYNSIKGHLDENYQYFNRGNKSYVIDKSSFANYFFDYCRFIRILCTNKVDIIVINTSLAKIGCTRDAIFIKILRIFKKKFVVFFHGWDAQYEKTLSKNKNYNKFPLNHFKMASAVIVLADDFRKKLKLWGFEQKIYLETTIVDDELLSEFKFDEEKFENVEDTFTFLYLARIEKAKGVFESVDLFDSLQMEFPNRNFRLIMAGEGSCLEDLKQYVANNKIKNVQFPGHILKRQKINTLQNSHFFLLPTSHGEGMPLSVLEAMAFGLPVLTTAIGGLKDFFEDGKMGVLVEKSDMKTALKRLIETIDNHDNLIKISRYNHYYATERFGSKNVTERLKKIFVEVFETL